MAPRSLVVLTGILLITPVASQPVLPDPCVSMLANADAATPRLTYARRNGGYCDGAVFEPNAGPGELPVVGVTGGAIRGRPPLQLGTVSRSPQAGEPERSVRWQGIAKDRAVNYRLDSRLRLGSSLSLGSDSALMRFTPSLSAELVSWSAWEDTRDRGRVYHPVIVDGQGGGGDLEIAVRPTIRVAFITYSVTDGFGTAVGTEKTLRDSSEPGMIRIFSLSAGKISRMSVTVTASGPGGRTQAAVINIENGTS